ncbi:MAG TPA: J domain-containing protein [Polyangiaceae bacterium]|nr:J domain-containing protein [Polyangiaceae bacterium]
MDESDRQRILDWDRTLDAASYYEILGVLEIADEASIRQAFHVFSLAFHPDVHLDADPDMAARVRRVFQRGAEAYRVLSHAQQRADYDLTLAKGHVRLGVPSIPPGSTSSGVRSLDELCHTASGKLHARKADRLISEGDLVGAKRELYLAMRCEEELEPELRERLEALDLALFAMGS